MLRVFDINVLAPLEPVVVKVIVLCLLLNVVQSLEDNAPRFVADAVGKLKV
jgi:hypothetical protein